MGSAGIRLRENDRQPMLRDNARGIMPMLRDNIRGILPLRDVCGEKCSPCSTEPLQFKCILHVLHMLDLLIKGVFSLVMDFLILTIE